MGRPGQPDRERLSNSEAIEYQYKMAILRIAEFVDGRRELVADAGYGPGEYIRICFEIRHRDNDHEDSVPVRISDEGLMSITVGDRKDWGADNVVRSFVEGSNIHEELIEASRQESSLSTRPMKTLLRDWSCVSFLSAATKRNGQRR